MNKNPESQIKLEHEVNPRLGIDSYIYSAENPILTHKTSHQKLPDGSIVDGAAVSLFSEKLDPLLFNCSHRDSAIQFSYLKEIASEASRSQQKYLSGNSFFCGDRFTNGNMCHTVLDHLIRGWQAHKSPVKVDRFIFFESTWNWAKEIIEQVLPQKKVLYIPEKENFKCERLLFCSNSWFGPGLGFAMTGLAGTPFKHPACHGNTAFLHELRKATRRLIKKHGKKDPESPKKIFISRKNTRRRFSNHSEIESAFERKRFTIVYLEDLSVTQQLKTFEQATHIAALHGAGLTNLISARKNTIVLEIFGHEGSHAYQTISKALGLKYTHLCAVDDEHLNAGKKASIESINSAINQMIT